MREAWAVAMEPVVAVGVICDTGEVIEADGSGGDGHEGAEQIKELIWGSRGAAGEVGEVL